MQTFSEHVSHVIDIVCTTAPVVLLAMLGGIVRSVQRKRGFKDIAMDASVSAFAAIIMNLLLEQSGLPMNVRAAICGITGYSAVEVLRILTNRVCTIARGGKEKD
ncbi:MAG: phage holin family protein [Pseudomonadota bacterium]